MYTYEPPSKPLEAVVHLTAATAHRHLACVAVADSLIDQSGQVALRRRHIQSREPGMVDGAGGSDEFFGPGDRLVILDQITEPSRICGDGGGVIEVAVVGSPPERGAQVGQLDGEPGVSLALSGAIPQRQYIGLALPEVASMGVAGLLQASPLATSCSSANWRIVSSIEKRVRPADRSATSSDFRTSASSSSRMRYSSEFSNSAMAQALSRSNPPENTEQQSRRAFSVSSSRS